MGIQCDVKHDYTFASSFAFYDTEQKCMKQNCMNYI